MKSPDHSESNRVIDHERHDPFTRNSRLLCYRIKRSLEQLSDTKKRNQIFSQTPEMVELLKSLNTKLEYLQAYLDKPLPSTALLYRHIEVLDSADQLEDAHLSILNALFKKNLLDFESTPIKEYLLSNFEVKKLGAAVHFTNPPQRNDQNNKKSRTAADYENKRDLIRVFDDHDRSYYDLIRNLAMHGVVSFQISILFHELIHRNQLARVAPFPEVAALITPLIHTSTVYQDKMQRLITKLNEFLSKRSGTPQEKYQSTKKASYTYLLIELDAYFAGFPFGFNLLDGKSAHKLINLLMRSGSYKGINPDVISKHESEELAERILFLKANGCPPTILNRIIRASDFDETTHSFTYIDQFVRGLRSNLPPHTRKQWKRYVKAWILDWETEKFINQIKVTDFVQNELRKRAVTLA